jgi:arsenate reductase
MAAALFDRAAHGQATALSAGTDPADVIHPVVRQALLEIGIDVGTTQPRLLTDDLARQADLLVTMGCGESCPVVPGLPRKDWPLDDPKDKSLEQVRQIRDEIARRVSALVAELGLSQ